MRLLFAVLLLGCHVHLEGDGTTDAPAGDTAVDTQLPRGPWKAPVMVPFSLAGDDDPSLTGDMLEIYFNRAEDIYVARRQAPSDPWGTPALVAELSVAAINDTTPEVTYDGLTIYFASVRAPTVGDTDIWMSTRATRAAVWGAPVKVTELATVSSEQSCPTSDDLHMVFETSRGGASVDIYATERASVMQPWGMPVPVTEVNTASTDGNPMLSSDRLELFMNSDVSGNAELYVATRAAPTQTFSPPVVITELADPTLDNDPWISPDGRTLYFTSDRGGDRRLWMTTR